MTQGGPSVLGRLAGRLAPHRGALALAAGLALVAGAGQAAYAFLAGPALRAIVQGGAITPPPLVVRLVPDAILHAMQAPGLGALPALLVLAALVRALASAGVNVLLPGAIARAAAGLREALFARLLEADDAFFHRHGQGDLVARATADVAALETAAQQILAAIVRDAAQASALLLACLVLDARLALATLVLVPAVIVPIKRFADTLRVVGREQLDGQARLLQRAEAAIFGHRVLLEADAAGWALGRLEAESARHLSTMRRSLFWRSAFTPALESIGLLALAALLYVAGDGGAAGVAPETLVSFVAAAYLAYQPLKSLGNVGQHLAAARAAGARIFELVDAPAGIADAPNARPLPPPREVALEHVSVERGGRVALQDVSLRLRAGEAVAIVGESGAGKSTLAALLLRLLDPTSGRVTFDGVDVREGTLASVRGQVAYVPQEAALFSGPARLSLGAPRAGDDRALIAGLASTGADELLARLPGGLEGELAAGRALSGGEKQRLAAARALGRPAALQLFDEATASLDTASEALLQRAFLAARRPDAITVVISHRLTSLAHVHRVVVLEAGRIVEEGAPAELLARGGRFFALFSRQAGGEERSSA